MCHVKANRLDLEQKVSKFLVSTSDQDLLQQQPEEIARIEEERMTAVVAHFFRFVFILHVKTFGQLRA
jgi:hypothetical protein